MHFLSRPSCPIPDLPGHVGAPDYVESARCAVLVSHRISYDYNDVAVAADILAAADDGDFEGMRIIVTMMFQRKFEAVSFLL